MISPTLLIDGGQSCFGAIETLLANAPFPTRNLRDNLADLNAQLAANRRGAELLEELVRNHGAPVVRDQMRYLTDRSSEALQRHLANTGFTSGEAQLFNFVCGRADFQALPAGLRVPGQAVFIGKREALDEEAIVGRLRECERPDDAASG